MLIYIDKHRLRADISNRLGSSGEGVGCSNHLIAASDICCDEAEMQRSGAGADSDCVLNADVFGEGAFKFAHFGTCANPLGCKHFADCRYLGFVNPRPAEGYKTVF